MLEYYSYFSYQNTWFHPDLNRKYPYYTVKGHLYDTTKSCAISFVGRNFVGTCKHYFPCREENIGHDKSRMRFCKKNRARPRRVV